MLRNESQIQNLYKKINLSDFEANCSKNALASSFVIELPHFLFIT
jgi:hypothetical protein